MIQITSHTTVASKTPAFFLNLEQAKILYSALWNETLQWRHLVTFSKFLQIVEAELGLMQALLLQKWIRNYKRAYIVFHDCH